MYIANQTITAVIAVNANEKVFLPITLLSLQAHIDCNKQYHIIIFADDLSEEERHALQSQVIKTNIQLDFIDAPPFLRTFRTKYPAQSYKASSIIFLAPLLLPKCDKALLMQGSVLINADIADLYNQDLGSHPIGACRHISLQAFLKKEHIHHYKNHILLNDISQYFSGRIILANFTMLRTNNLVEKLIWFISRVQFIRSHEDGLNIFFQGKVKYIDSKWNYLHLRQNEHTFVLQHLQGNLRQQYLNDTNMAHIIAFPHNGFPFTSSRTSYYTTLWFEYARKIGIYNQAINMLISHTLGAARLKNKPLIESFYKKWIRIGSHPTLLYYRIMYKLSIKTKRKYYKNKYQQLKHLLKNPIKN